MLVHVERDAPLWSACRWTRRPFTLSCTPRAPLPNNSTAGTLCNFEPWFEDLACL